MVISRRTIGFICIIVRVVMVFGVMRGFVSCRLGVVWRVSGISGSFGGISSVAAIIIMSGCLMRGR